MPPNPLRRRALRSLDTLRRAVRQDVPEVVARRQVVYCGDHVVLARTAGGRMIYLDTRDASVAPIIALGGDYEPDVAAVLGRLVRPG
jgi:hypothetical protein